MMKYFSKTALLIALLGSVVFVSSCKDDEDDNNIVESKWTDAQISESKTNCYAGETEEEYCDCFISKVSTAFTYEEFMELADSDDVNDNNKLYAVTSSCDN